MWHVNKNAAEINQVGLGSGVIATPTMRLVTRSFFTDFTRFPFGPRLDTSSAKFAYLTSDFLPEKRPEMTALQLRYEGS